MSVSIIQLRGDGEPKKQARSVAQLAKHLGVDFKPESLQLTCVALARRIEELEFQLELLRFELRRPMWRRAIDKLTRGGA